MLVFITTFGISSCKTMQETRAEMLKLPAVAPEATYSGQEACMGCHEEIAGQFAGSVHDRLLVEESAIGSKGCETCHGPGSKHIEEENPEYIIRFDKIKAVEASSVCLRCHNEAKLMDWHGSEHALNDVSCSSCHKMHQEKLEANAALLSSAEPGVCFDCHRDIQARLNYPSHHPVKEGHMNCSSCHNAHGSFTNNLKTEERVNDLCFNCHSRYQGPYAFEHAPVIESCLECHEPHGTVANNLLVHNEPYLCLQCHHLHFHTVVQSNPSGSFPITPSNTLVTTDGQVDPHGMQRAVGAKCTICHSQVHGSDLPSLSTPGQGRALTR